MIKIGDKVQRKPEYRADGWDWRCKPYSVDAIFTVTHVGDYNVPGKIAWVHLLEIKTPDSYTPRPMRFDYHRFDPVEDVEPVEEI